MLHPMNDDYAMPHVEEPTDAWEEYKKYGAPKDLTTRVG
jgi:hypothetical protein